MRRVPSAEADSANPTHCSPHSRAGLFIFRRCAAGMEFVPSDPFVREFHNKPWVRRICVRQLNVIYWSRATAGLHDEVRWGVRHQLI